MKATGSHNIIIGPLTLIYQGADVIDATPVGGTAASVEAHIYTMLHADDWSLTLAYTMFPECKDIRCLEYSVDTPDILHRLTHGLRMVVYYSPVMQKEWVELSQARVKNGACPLWSNLMRATHEQLMAGSGLDIRSALTDHDASYGTREKVLRDKNRRRGYFCAAFAPGNREAPLMAYAFTRVLPLLNGMR